MSLQKIEFLSFPSSFDVSSLLSSINFLFFIMTSNLICSHNWLLWLAGLVSSDYEKLGFKLLII